MPLKFSCPQCKNVLTVDEKLAGKTAKCPKCAAAIRIPIPKAASLAAASKGTSVAASPGLVNALAELTESDFNRHSPFEAVYTPPKAPPISSDVLRKVAANDARKPVKTGAGPPVVQVVYAILNFLQAFVLLLIVGVMLFARDWIIENLKNQSKTANFDLPDPTMPAVLFCLYAFVLIVLGIGLLQKRLWGYVFATIIYVLCSSIYFTQLLMNFSDRRQLVGIGILFTITAFMTSYFFRPTCFKYYGIKTWTVPLICAAVGAVPIIPFVIATLVFWR